MAIDYSYFYRYYEFFKLSYHLFVCVEYILIYKMVHEFNGFYGTECMTRMTNHEKNKHKMDIKKFGQNCKEKGSPVQQ